MTDPPATPIDRQHHWDDRYATVGSAQVSWHEATPGMSLDALEAAGVTPRDSVIDVGGGASHLVDALLARRFEDVTVLDVSEVALTEARDRLNDPPQASWIRADLLHWQPDRAWSAWHDRAVFHFLTDPSDRVTYRDLLREAVEPGGAIVVATFDLDGPEWCSGLAVKRYDAAGLASELGPDFDLLASGTSRHRTPTGTDQPFVWVALRR